ncbi:MAG: hypothetical protein ACYTBJ_01920 [Planctomycetota bacterium]
MSIWSNTPPVTPYQLIATTRDPQGRIVYVLPPTNANPLEMVICLDWVRHEDLWQKMKKAEVVGMVPDGRALVDTNYRLNKKLGFRHSWADLWGREQGKTCIMVCPGPSLAASEEEIRNLKGRDDHFTMGINRAILSPIHLDYFFLVDRRAVSDGGGISDWIRREPRRTTLIASTTARHAICRPFAKRYWGEHHIASEDSGMMNMTTNLWITLADAMFGAYKLGATRILLYGCDFSMPGQLARDRKGPCWHCGNYYFDMDAVSGMEIRQHLYKTQRPVRGINDSLVFVNWEFVTHAAYATCMALMLERGGIVVDNKTPCGILWETWKEGRHGNDDLSDPLRVREEAVP